MTSSIFLSIGWRFLLQYFKSRNTTYVTHFSAMSLDHGLLKLYSSLIFPEPAVESIGSQAHLFLKFDDCYIPRLPLLIQLPELYPVDRNRLSSFILSLRLGNSDTLTLTL